MKPMRLVNRLILLAICSISSCYTQEPPEASVAPRSQNSIKVPNYLCDSVRIDDNTIRILFVGNSLTYSNSIPLLVEEIGSANGKSIATETLAFPNYALEDHWLEGKMQQAICQGNFDFVVVQQGPSSQADGRAMLFDYGQRIKDVCLSRGTELAFFMVWPAKTNYHTFNGVIKNYTDAANATNSILCAVGIGFKGYGDIGDFRFYSSDGFHPSPEGSQIAAEIIYSTLVKN